MLVSHTEAFSMEITTVESTVDNIKYVVLNLPDKINAANRLARLRLKLLNFIEHLDSKVINNKEFKKKIKRIQGKFKAVLTESRPGSKFTSFTTDKGRKIHMCIRERDENNRFIDDNTLFFVALHELAHVMTISIGHKQDFWQNFEYLLKQAINMGYYKYHPYHTSPKKYCGMEISDTPYKI
uniref:WLM domain-containing protein n=1 Tax=viral metagenome TaxID=1070528 RepID=A0A6C0JB12_9ZZZZ